METHTPSHMHTKLREGNMTLLSGPYEVSQFTLGYTKIQKYESLVERFPLDLGDSRVIGDGGSVGGRY